MYKKYEKLKAEFGVNDRVVSSGTGIAPSTLSDWKKGLYTPKADKIMKIAHFFNVPIEYFYEWSEKK